jgi:hypothetical protein
MSEELKTALELVDRWQGESVMGLPAEQALTACIILGREVRAKDAELARLRGVVEALKNADNEFVRIWGLSVCRCKKWSSAGERLECFHLLAARGHTDAEAALPSPAEAVNGPKHHACDLLQLLDSDRAETGENCAECLTLVAKLAKYKSALAAEAGEKACVHPSFNDGYCDSCGAPAAPSDAKAGERP